MSQYDPIASAYRDIVAQTDLMASFDEHSWLQACGDITGLHVLDLGCGTGLTSRALARSGAHVVGVDQSQMMIEEAQLAEHQNPLGILYLQHDAAALPHLGDFDLVAPTYLLHYARSRAELTAFAQGIARNLKPGGRVVGMNNNPNQPVSRRVPNALSFEEWEDEPFVEGSRIKVHLLGGDGHQEVTFFTRFWRKQTYEDVLHQAGFVEIAWIPMQISAEGRQYFANWQELEAVNSTILITARKA
jgi:SAM-dependent methyltransferase